MSAGNPTGDSRPSDSLNELDEIVAEYIRADEAGEAPDRAFSVSPDSKRVDLVIFAGPDRGALR